MNDETTQKLQELMQLSMMAANGPTQTNGYGAFPPTPFEGFPAPDAQFVSPDDVFPFPLGGWGG